MASSSTTTSRLAQEGGPDRAGSCRVSGATGVKKDKHGVKELHLHIGTGNDRFEDSGIGLDDNLPPVESSPLKVLATPPSGKKKNLISSPKSAPTESHISDMTFTSDHVTSRTTTHASRVIHTVHAAERSRHGDAVSSRDVTARHSDANRQGDVSSDMFTPTGTPPGGHSPGIFSSLRESVSRTVSSSSSSSTSGSASKVSESHVTTKTSFQIGSDSEDDVASTGSGRSSQRSSGKSTSGGRLIEAKGKGRFRRMLNPLRRSHSAGCSQDVPAHALFLKHEADSKSEKKLSTSQKSVDKSVSTSPVPDVARAAGSDSDGDDADRKSSKSKKKSLARDLKDKMAFLRRRHTDTALSSKMDGKAQRPTAEAVAEWARDLEHLLYDKVGLDMFRDFLQSEFSDENLEFWVACEEYKMLRDSKMPVQAQKIYTDFVAVQAPREINLDSKTRMACRLAMSNPNKHTFEQAQKRIAGLMEKDSYPRFLKSETYQELCHELKLNQAS